MEPYSLFPPDLLKYLKDTVLTDGLLLDYPNISLECSWIADGLLDCFWYVRQTDNLIEYLKEMAYNDGLLDCPCISTALYISLDIFRLIIGLNIQKPTDVSSLQYWMTCPPLLFYLPKQQISHRQLKDFLKYLNDFFEIFRKFPSNI